MHPNNIEFIKYVKRECRRVGVTCILSSDKKLIIDGLECGGYFDSENKILAVSSGNEEWLLSTLVHEYSHLEQWLYDDPAFTMRIRGGHDSQYIITQWIEGKDYTEATIDSAISSLRECELNCEIRAINNINKFSLKLNKEQYYKNANAYILSFNYIKKVRKQTFKYSCYDPLIVAIMPSDFTSLDYNVLTRHQYLVYNSVLI